MMKMNIIKFVLLCIAPTVFADDLGHVVSGAPVQDFLGKTQKEKEASPFIEQKNKTSNIYIHNQKRVSEQDWISGDKIPEVELKDKEIKILKNVGYVVPGTFEHQKNYLSLDKKQFAKEFVNKSSSAFNFSFIKDSFKYESQNDIINRTISEGYQHVKGGMILLRSDQYISKTFALNTFWSIGTGLSYNAGKGTFITGVKSDTRFTLWEIPLDFGIGFEVPVYNWVKFVGVGGASGMILAQNRNDFKNGEDGKNKFQFGYGAFLGLQFKINLSMFNDDLAYDLFTSSQITRLSLNIESRLESYQHFQDTSLAISGASLGAGFSFEFL